MPCKAIQNGKKAIYKWQFPSRFSRLKRLTLIRLLFYTVFTCLFHFFQSRCIWRMLAYYLSLSILAENAPCCLRPSIAKNASCRVILVISIHLFAFTFFPMFVVNVKRQTSSTVVVHAQSLCIFSSEVKYRFALVYIDCPCCSCYPRY